MSSTLTLDDVYLDNDAFAERVPHETFKLLRDEAPVHWYDWEHGRGFWCITRYDDVVAVMKDWRTFSSETGATALEDLDPDQIEARKSMLDTDPPGEREVPPLPVPQPIRDGGVQLRPPHRRRAAEGSARRPRLQARDVGGRGRQPADRAGVRHHVPAARRRRQRDHAPVDRAR